MKSTALSRVLFKAASMSASRSRNHLPVAALGVVLMLFVVGMAPVAVIAQELPGTTIFRKELPKSRQLVVTRQEVPYVPPTQAEIEKLHRDFPGASFSKPDHVWRYSLGLGSPRESASPLLWTITLLAYNGNPWGDFKVMDATYDGKVAVIVFQSGRFVEGNITRKNNKFAIEERTDSSVATYRLLLQPVSSTESPIVSAKISLGKPPQPISVVLSDSQGKKRRFIWQKKWVEQKPKGKPIPQ